jgi:hypothetical protein
VSDDPASDDRSSHNGQDPGGQAAPKEPPVDGPGGGDEDPDLGASQGQPGDKDKGDEGKQSPNR